VNILELQVQLMAAIIVNQLRQTKLFLDDD